MVTELFRRKGPWVLVAAVCVFLGGNAVLDARYSAQMEALKKARPISQSLDVNGISRVYIRAESRMSGVERLSVRVRFDANAKDATVRIDNKTTKLLSAVSAGTLDITVQLLKLPN